MPPRKAGNIAMDLGLSNELSKRQSRGLGSGKNVTATQPHINGAPDSLLHGENRKRNTRGGQDRGMQASQSRWTPGAGWNSLAGGIDETAQLVLAFGSTNAITDAVLWRELKSRHPNAIVMGCSTGGEIFGCEVSDDGLSATAVSFERTTIAAAEAKLEDAGSSFAAGRAVGTMLARSGLRALFVLSDGTKINGSELVRGLRDAVGADVVLTGGLAGDGANFGTTYVGLNTPPEPGKVVAIGFYGDGLVVGHGSCGGWDVFGPERRITKASANVLYELDGQPALDLYKRYLGEEAAGFPAVRCFSPCASIPPISPSRPWCAPSWASTKARAA